MELSQTILFTIMPRGISLNSATLPMSVFISPRLRGADLLGAFPDWLAWTARRQDMGLRLVLECGGQTRAADLPREQLRPELWRALFNEATFVRSHEFDDYSDRFVASYPLRAALSAVKGVYQAAGVALAQPEVAGGGRDQEYSRARVLAGLVDGFQLDWDAANGRKWREQQRQLQGRSKLRGAFVGYSAADLGEDGLFRTGAVAPGSNQSKQLNQGVAERFAVFSHQPAGAPVTRERLDERTVLDFHQALSSLHAYPALQRMLGLVFDFELPIDFVAPAPFGAPGQIRVVQVEGGWDSATLTSVPATSTAYVHAASENTRLFFTAPRSMVTKNEPAGALGLLALDPTRFGLAQVDIDGGMHKTIALAEMAHQTTVQGPFRSQHPQVFDPNTTLAALRSGGLSLYADSRAQALLGTFNASKAFNDALQSGQGQPRPFAAEDLVRGYRLDVWDATTGAWHSLHRRNSSYVLGENEVAVEDEEGFVQLAATQAAPNADGSRDTDDLYLHEAFARWAGWSLSAPRPGKHLTRAADPDQAVPDANAPDPENEPITPFKMTSDYQVVRGSLPRLRFGGRYRFRARVVDLAGNSLGLDDKITELLTPALSLPRGAATFPYLRFEPVAAPALVLRDERGVSGAGSSLERIVIRSFNSDPALDSAPADLAANDRHLAPPRGSVELGERHGMFDDASGKLNASPAIWDLIRQRDEGQFATAAVASLAIGGEPQPVPLEGAARIDTLPYLPDPLARGAAFRNLPGTPAGSLGRAGPSDGAAGPIAHVPLEDANPRPGSATLIGWGGQEDWQQVAPFRFALEEGDGPPAWDPAERVLTVFLPKGQTSVVPISSVTGAEDLKLMGVWQWLREYIEFLTTEQPQSEFYRAFASKDQIAHILQLAVEGGHWMLTPPTLLTLVHAVQQPLGLPEFTRLSVQLDPKAFTQLATEPEDEPTAATELDPVTAWRAPGSNQAYLLGGLHVHGGSTAKVDLRAAWIDPVDDLAQEAPGSQSFAAFVDSVPLNELSEETLYADGGARAVGYYDPEHDLLCFARAGTMLGNLASGATVWSDAAPRHQIGDTRHHVVEYTAVATSRYREYFPQQQDGVDLDFTRSSAPVRVDLPASARPLAPQVRYVVPTFGWQREASTNLTRSLRAGGGLRVYLERPWFSSGAGELLGVALWSGGELDREAWKAYITQWGQDPIWLSAPLGDAPRVDHFPDAVASEFSLPLEARTKAGETRQVDVAGHAVEFDRERKLWYCDLTVNTQSATYAPFVRLALVRYQPHALLEAKLSRVVLADFVQLTPERAAMITADPNQPGRLRVVVSGPAPRGPLPQVRRSRIAPAPANPVERPTVINVVVQERDPSFGGDLGWRTAPAGSFSLSVEQNGALPADENLMRWAGTIRFAEPPAPGQYRLLITEREYITADYAIIREQDNARLIEQPSRLIYAETIELDTALLAPPNVAAARTVVG